MRMRRRRAIIARMSDNEHTIALCCYKYRAVVLERCEQCKSEYACPEFKTKAAVVQFNAIIPPSMLLSPLPLELWPPMCPNIVPDVTLQSSQCPASEPSESPIRRLVSMLGLTINRDPHST